MLSARSSGLDGGNEIDLFFHVAPSYCGLYVPKYDKAEFGKSCGIASKLDRDIEPNKENMDLNSEGHSSE